MINATVTSVNVSTPRCILIDDHDHLVNVENNGNYLNRFHPANLTLIDRTLLPGSTTANIAYHQGAYFIGTDDNTILIVNSDNLNTINVLTAPNMSYPRDMIFLQDGREIVLTSSIHSTSDGRTWKENLFVNGATVQSPGQGSQVRVDDCQRKWLSMFNAAFLTFDNQGNLLGNFTPPWNKAFDAIFTRNYVMYVSQRSPLLSIMHTLRYDPDQSIDHEQKVTIDADATESK